MTTDGGRFDFEDGGAYVGGWLEGKAHGLGLVTGPRGQGEFAGYWEDGFEASGVYIWPSGNTYEGEWRHGKRHGLGIEIKGRWIYKGEWMTGFKGRYGVRESEASGAKYEGTWQLGMQDGAGVETYSDGSTFSGSWFHGTRHGLGIRQSVPYGLAAHYKDERRLRESLTSLRSQDEEQTAIIDAKDRARRLDDSRGGFVLRGRVFDPTVTTKAKRNSLTKNLLNKLKKQRSTGDITDQRSSRFSGSIRSTYSAQSQMTDGSVVTSPDFYEEIIDPSTTETFFGDWKQDKRSGFGVAERSDGLKYEGEWEANKKHGYGCTTFPDGTSESGKFKNNVLIVSTQKRSKLFLIKSSRLKDRVEVAVKEARNAQQEALKKAENANSRQQISKQKAEMAIVASEKARQDAATARQIAREYAPDFHQPGEEFLKRRLESEAFSQLNSVSLTNGNKSRHLPRQRHIEDSSSPQRTTANTLSPNVLVDGTLQVGGGGSRRGSFRAMRRGSNSSRPSDQRTPTSGTMNNLNPPHHPHNPQQMASSGRLDVDEVISRLHSDPAQSSTLPSSFSSRRSPGQHSFDRVEPLVHVMNSSSTTDHFDQYKTLSRRKRDSGIGRDSSFEESPNSGVGSERSAHTKGDSDSGLSDLSGNSMSRCRRRTMPSLLSSPPVRPTHVGPTLEDVTHSVENLQDSAYIIENGIRKRVQAAPKTSGPSQQASNDPDLPQLPRQYRIESQAQLAKDLGEGSLPDVSVCQHIKKHHIMSREEISRLSQARRLELLRQEERRRQGEIIIRLADLKDWCKEHLLLVFVFIINIGLGFLFLFLLTTPKT